MRTRIQKWGNGLGLRIPKFFAREADVEAGSMVDLAIEDGSLVIRRLRCPKYSLDQLLEGVTSRNLHKEIETEEPVCGEAW